MSALNRAWHATKRTARKISNKTEEVFDAAATSVKIKNLEAYLAENHLQMSISYGCADPSHRYYMLTTPDGMFIFGYDSEQHQPSPVLSAIITH